MRGLRSGAVRASERLMMIRTHGGDWAAFEREYGVAPLDFSANVSPLGVPAGVRAAIASAAAEIERYPDPLCRSLREAIAEREGVAAEQVLCGNGASDLIYRAIFAAKPRRALVTAPAFGEYEAALKAAGSEIVRCPLGDTFRLDASFLEAINDGIDFVILCQPNNPSGVTVEPELLRRIALRCAERDTAGRTCRVMVDECFVDFLNPPERFTCKPILREFPNLLLLNAFTKLYAMAGVRLGYALCTDAAFLADMYRGAPAWPVSHLAQAAGLAALRETDYVARVRALIRVERPWLFEQLAALGLRVVPGEANFLLFRCATPLDAPLRKRGILVRGCDDFVGLDETWYRIAVRTHEENQRLIAALTEVLA